MRYLLTLLLAFATSACVPIPHKEDASPTITGKVIDALTGKGVAEVAIEIHPWKESEAAAVTFTDESGNFVIGKLQRWHAVHWLMGGDPIMYGYVVISGRGYDSTEKDYFLSTGELYVEGGPNIELGEITLSRK